MSSRILIAEDSDADVEFLTAILKEFESVEVTIVGDGAEALDYLYRRGQFEGTKNQQPDVIFMDIRMPKCSGITVLEKVKSDASLKSIPVVMLSSSDTRTDVSRCYDLGANAYVVKPVDFEEYRQTIKDLGRFWGVLNTPCGHAA